MLKDYNSLIAQVEKPLRYINHELNAVHKKVTAGMIKFCFIYPDLYEIGISHLGLKILYSIINQSQGAVADRAYTPGVDFGSLLLQNKIPLHSIEHKLPLQNFDLLGFTLPSELTYTNILYTLDIAQIPLHAEDRGDEYPIILAGGMNAVNPQPLSLFFDAFFIGEAEEGIIIIKDICQKYPSKVERLKKISTLSFIYVPRYSGDKLIQALKYNNFAQSSQTHTPQLVPLLQGTHDRYTAEIMRGCTHGCRFCQAGMFYRPVRVKNPALVLDQLLSEVKNSGWDSVGLMSLSTNDYPWIKDLLSVLVGHLEGSGISLSLPSLRLDNIDKDLVSLINYLKKTGITLAPEAGSQRLRNIINKNLTEDEILLAIKFACQAGAKLIKLYFMIGLPFETEEDIEEIITLVEKVISLTNRKMQINISLSPFVPKPMTPFQWVKMGTEREVLEKAQRIKFAFQKYKFMKVTYHTIELAFLEAVLARGNLSVGYVIEKAYRKGAKFDGWREYFDYEQWREAAEEVNFNWQQALHGYTLNDPLPWDNINVGVSKEFLWHEYQKAEAITITANCRLGQCVECGVNCLASLHLDEFTHQGAESLTKTLTIPCFSSSVPDHQEGNSNDSSRYLYRIHFSKLNNLKYLSHLDFLRLIHRLLMISGLPILFSEGYSPHPRTAFCPPLASGIEGKNEFFEVWMSKKYENKRIMEQMNRMPMHDLSFHQVELMYENRMYASFYQPIAAFIYEELEMKINQDDLEFFPHKIIKYNEKDNYQIIKEKKGQKKIINLKDIIVDIKIGEELLITKKIQGASIYDILESIFGITREKAGAFQIIRRKIMTKLD